MLHRHAAASCFFTHCCATLTRVQLQRPSACVQGPEAESHAHEAGYDAYMTGAAFACLLRLYEASGAPPSHSTPMGEQQPSMAAVEQQKGRLNLGRSAAEPASVSSQPDAQ